ncbi:MAG: alpha/beta fold hydrolase [Steroidobacteraceae bacterium]
MLLVHGAGGGHDQGMMLGRPLAARGYRAIAVSRFGYLGTPAPQNPSPQAQADAHVCLLDALGVPRAAIIGASAGAPSAMQFAIRYPERCAALVLLVPLAYRPRPPEERASEPAAAMRVALKALESDFALWSLLKVAPAVVTRTLLATPPEVLANSRPIERERISAIRESILPVTRRATGLHIDGAVAATLPRYQLESIHAPTLIFSLEDDLFDTYAGAQYTARHIRGARFIGFASGGHTWVGHQEEIVAETARFMRPVS